MGIMLSVPIPLPTSAVESATASAANVAGFPSTILIWIGYVIWVVLGLSTLVSILDFFGWLPEKFHKRLQRNHVNDTIAVLKEAGVDLEQYKSHLLPLKFPTFGNPEELQACVLDTLEKVKIPGTVTVGHSLKNSLPCYYDLMGAMCDHSVAESVASYLTTHWKEECRSLVGAEFDIVVTPKSGSALLGYEFAKLVDKPFVLHEIKPRFEKKTKCLQQHFLASTTLKGKKVLIVDDSTTGGSMVIAAIKDLKKQGCIVNHCLVVFAPKSETARGKLSELSVSLHCIVEVNKK